MTAVDNTLNNPSQRAPLVTGAADYASITNDVCRIAEQYRPPRSWYIAFAISVSRAGRVGPGGRLSDHHRHWRVGQQQSGVLGF